MTFSRICSAIFAVTALFLALGCGAGSEGAADDTAGNFGAAGATSVAGTSSLGGSTADGGAATSAGMGSGGAPVQAGGAAAMGGASATDGGGTAGENASNGGSNATGGNHAGGAGSGNGANHAGGAGNANGGGNAGGASNGSGGAGPNPACAYSAPAGSPVARYGQLKVVGTKLEDHAGNPVQLKGVSSYWLNWESTKYAESKSALQYMRDNWKLTALRAAMGTDASSGYLTSTANQTALQARIETIIQNALSLGVYVVVDWHTEKAVAQQTQSIAFFTGLARKYGGCPNLIYEDYNEPTGVTWAQIKPYHQAVVNAIRAIDADNLIIMGTPNWSQDVDLAAQDQVSGTNLLYTLHWYSCSHKASLRAKGTTAISRGIALFVTECAGTSANGGVAPQNTVCEDESNSWFTWMAQNDVSGLTWKLASGTDSSNIFASGSKPPVDGPFPDSVLSQTNGSSPGDGQFVVNRLRQ